MADDVVTTVQRGYAFEGACVELGALVVDGAPRADAPVRVPLAMLNRHGLVAGATGTGKTKTLQVMAEQIAAAGVPVFAADIKGDLSGLASPGVTDAKIAARAESIGQAWTPTAYPVELLRLGDDGVGVPVRASVTSFGPTLLAKVLELNETQESSLGLVFHYADTAGLPLVGLDDLRAVIEHLTSDEGKEDLRGVGGLARQTAGVILRELVNFAATGADAFFGEPEFDVSELLRTTDDGLGVITLLELPSVLDRPVLFSTFLMWLLAELFETLPEVGDSEKPKLVFFFDEAHLLFKDASKDFLSALVQTVRLIRSKGVGVFFVTQSPKDVHEDVLAQLGSRVQHQLRAFTPNDAAALRAAVRTYPTSGYDLEELLTTLGIGEAVVTVMSEKGAPTPVAHTMLPAPRSLMAPSPADVLSGVVSSSPLAAKYAERLDRESAYELLTGKIAAGPGEPLDAGTGAAEPAGADGAPAEPLTREEEIKRLEAEIRGLPVPTTVPTPAPSPAEQPEEGQPKPRPGSGSRPRSRPGSRRAADGPLDAFLKTAGRELAKEIARGVFGTRRRR
ncbi:helicase HerA-like domain-containing protein [Jiangella gansuensis]|uniref:helicase HerA-like domain-containing protein n=1 Tax=Jiangella gansuensis TaxID=281473 RepID=UPI000478BDEE|nr:helicase HerA-like domain-containing protein [Jiangella gansuensis]